MLRRSLYCYKDIIAFHIFPIVCYPPNSKLLFKDRARGGGLHPDRRLTKRRFRRRRTGLERNAEKLDTISSSRSIRIKDSVLFCGSIFCWREWIKHLQRIATLNETRNNTPDLRPQFDGWRMCFDCMMLYVNTVPCEKRCLGVAAALSWDKKTTPTIKLIANNVCFHPSILLPCSLISQCAFARFHS